MDTRHTWHYHRGVVTTKLRGEKERLIFNNWALVFSLYRIQSFFWWRRCVGWLRYITAIIVTILVGHETGEWPWA